MTFVTMPGNLPDLEMMWSPSTAASATPSYVDMLQPNWTLAARSLSIRRGRTDEFARFETATLDALLDNRTRAYEAVKPMRKLRVRARWPKGAGGTIYDRFVGYTGDEYPQQYPANGLDAVVPITAYDGFGVLALAQLPATFSRPAELSGARVGAVLDQIGWPAGDRSIAVGVAAVAALAPGTNQTALAHLQDVHDAEGGSLFIDRSGNLVFQDRHYRNLSEASSRQTFATVADGENGLHYDDCDVRYGGRLWNGVQITPDSGVIQEWNDATAQADYYPRVLTKSLPMSSDADALALAQHIIYLNKGPVMRCYSMSLLGASDAARLWPALLALEISHHVTVRVTPPARTGTFVFEQTIEGCTETISPDGWRLEFPMSPYDATSYFMIDTNAIDGAAVIGY